MKALHTLNVLAVAALVVATAAPIASAQEPASPSRTEVKAETRAAQRAHELLPAGEGALPPEKPFRSTKSRSQRKADTVASRRAGELLPAGEIERKPAPFRAEKTRSQRKAETLAAAKAKKLIPAGESVSPSK